MVPLQFDCRSSLGIWEPSDSCRMQQHPRPLATDQPQRCLDQWNRKSLSPPTGSRSDPRPERDQPLGVDAIKLFYRRNLKLLVISYNVYPWL
jgi:hypothetical protein